MMLDILSFVLKPIIVFMDIIFLFFVRLTDSAGFAVILLALTSAIAVMPLQKYGRRIEDRLRAKMRLIDDELAPHKANLKGEALFNKMEEIYQKHKYHPIQSVGLGMSFIVLLPVLISAIILIGSHPALTGQGFLFVSDLSRPDRLLGSLNLLPIVMTLITILDAIVRFRNDRSVLVRFLITAFILFLLVYNLAAALVIYWTMNVAISFLVTLSSQKRQHTSLRSGGQNEDQY